MSTPTVVARATGLVVPNKVIATATASSKKFDAPIIPAGAAISCDIPNIFEAIQAIKNINTVCVMHLGGKASAESDFASDEDDDFLD